MSTDTWFGYSGEALATTLSVPKVIARGQVTSTMDVAHDEASQGASTGTLVLAEEQLGGRGRGGRQWASARRAGVWATLIERPRTTDGIDVLSLRVGLQLAQVLERWTPVPIQLKWPNDLFVDGRKLGGILIEVRWRVQRPDWVAIGVGVNLTAPNRMDTSEAASLVGAEAIDVIGAMLPAVRTAAATVGPLTEAELAAFAERDLTTDREVSAPAKGIARGITPDGALLIESTSGITAWRAGSLVLSP